MQFLHPPFPCPLFVTVHTYIPSIHFKLSSSVLHIPQIHCTKSHNVKLQRGGATIMLAALRDILLDVTWHVRRRWRRVLLQCPTCRNCQYIHSINSLQTVKFGASYNLSSPTLRTSAAP